MGDYRCWNRRKPFEGCFDHLAVETQFRSRLDQAKDCGFILVCTSCLPDQSNGIPYLVVRGNRRQTGRTAIG